MKKKCAILVRGHSKRVRNDQYDPIYFDATLGAVQSFKQNVLIPLKEQYDVDVYLVPSNNDNIAELCMELSPVQFRMSINNNDLAQSTNMLTGLDMIRKQDHYDCIFITRFDILYKKKITEFINNKNQDVIIPFFDVQTTPNRCCDIMQWINNDSENKVFDKFIESILDIRNNTAEYNAKNTWEKREKTFHDLYNPLTQRGLSVGVMVEGNYDSNTSRWPGAWKLPEGSRNEIFALSGRLYYYDDINHPTLFKPTIKKGS